MLPRELACKLLHGERRDQTDDAVWNACGGDDKIFPVGRNVGDGIGNRSRREQTEAVLQKRAKPMPIDVR
jgi:hypothetical protein